MDLKGIVSITGMPGLYKAITQRGDGMIVTSLEAKETKFVSNRNNSFASLDAISIFTHEDSKDLKLIFEEMLKQETTNPPVDSNAGNDILKKYLKSILPDYDEARVYVSDIKKLLKWYAILKKENLLTVEEKKEEVKEEKTVTEKTTS